MIGHWPLSEDSGTTAYDYSGEENHGTANGAGPSGTGTVDGPLGQSAYDFDGSDDYIDIPNLSNISLDGSDDFTFAVWFTDSSPTSDFLRLMDFQQDAELRGPRHDGSDNIEVQIDDGTSNISVSFPVTDYNGATFNNITFRYISGVKFDIWLNGVMKDENTSGVSSFNTGNAGNNNAIGSLNDGSTQYWDGAIADVRVYDRALSPSEVAGLYETSQFASYVSETKTL